VHSLGSSGNGADVIRRRFSQVCLFSQAIVLTKTGLGRKILRFLTKQREGQSCCEYIKIDGTNLVSSRIALGTWAIGGWMWGGTDEKESIRTNS